MFTWLIITLCCNFPEQSLGVLRVRAVSLWLVQTAQTTKNITALGPAPGFPFPTPPPTFPDALRLSEMYSGWFFFCCIYPTVLSKSMLPFVSYVGNKAILAMPLEPKIRIDVKTLLYHILNAGFLFLPLRHHVCVAGLHTIMHLYCTYIDAYLLDHVEPEHLVIKLLLWMTDSIWECCCNHRKQCPPSAPCPRSPQVPIISTSLPLISH